MSILKVTKRNGSIEDFDVSKINKVIRFATEGLNISHSLIELKVNQSLYNGIWTSEIHDLLIRSASNLISVEEPDYQYAAARLAIYQIRKQAYDDYTPPHLFDHIKKLVELKRYTDLLLQEYSKEEIDELNRYIDHDRDNKLTYIAVQQIIVKYAVKDKHTEMVLESPQMIFMLVPMVLFMEQQDKTERLKSIKQFYDNLSNGDVALATPVIGGVRTITKQFSSCVLIDSDDSLDSINASSNTIVKYVSQRAGIGLNVGRIRGIGSTIRNGEATHTGIVPFIKLFQEAVSSCNQGNIRKGAATLYIPIWHYEIEDVVSLKNNKGTDETRARKLDYSVQFNQHFYKKAIGNEEYCLFSPSEVPNLYESFFSNQEEFERLYEQYSNDPNVRKRRINAMDLFVKVASERSATGRIYIQNVENTNKQSPFKSTIYMSNLCVEIALPTKPIPSPRSDEGEISLCTLSAINIYNFVNEKGEIDYPNLQKTVAITVNVLDNLLSYQDYPFIQAENGTKGRRPLGISMTNYSATLAKMNIRYNSEEALIFADTIMEAISYFAIQESVRLAKEKAPCPMYKDTHWSDGITPLQRANENALKLISRQPTFSSNQTLIEQFGSWETLSEDLKKYGIRNSTLTTMAPTETSSAIVNATNGIEPPRGLVASKVSKDGVMPQLVPDVEKYKDQYDLMWGIKGNEYTLKLGAVLQKWVCQSISLNLKYDPKDSPTGTLKTIDVIKDILTANKLGIKTLYYNIIRDYQAQNGDHLLNQANEPEGCDGGACAI